MWSGEDFPFGRYIEFMKTLLALLFVAASVTSTAFATAQFPDNLLIDGKEVPIH